MKVITVSGPPSSGKTSVVLRTAALLKARMRIGVVKFDCLFTDDDALYQKQGIPVRVGFSGGLCPDHFFVSNIADCFDWAKSEGLDALVSESAGLCNRCSPHIRDLLAVCVIDALSGVNTPKKIGPMLKFADAVVITKGDIISQAEREVFSFKVRQANPRAKILFINGISGQGAFDLARLFEQAPEADSLEQRRLRFTMPAALCSYCLGQTRIGAEYQMGNVKKMSL